MSQMKNCSTRTLRDVLCAALDRLGGLLRGRARILGQLARLPLRLLLRALRPLGRLLRDRVRAVLEVVRDLCTPATSAFMVHTT